MLPPDTTSKGDPPCRKIETALANQLYYADPKTPGYKENSEAAKTLCRSNGGCQYLAECLTYAIEEDEPFVYGGTTEQDRAKLRRKIRMQNPRLRPMTSQVR